MAFGFASVRRGPEVLIHIIGSQVVPSGNARGIESLPSARIGIEQPWRFCQIGILQQRQNSADSDHGIGRELIAQADVAAVADLVGNGRNHRRRRVQHATDTTAGWVSARLTQSIGGFSERVVQREGYVRADSVLESHGRIVVGLIKSRVLLIEGEARAVGKVPTEAGPRLIERQARPNRVADIAHRSACSGGDVVVIGGRKTQSAAQVVGAGGLRSKLHGVAFAAHRRGCEHPAALVVDGPNGLHGCLGPDGRPPYIRRREASARLWVSVPYGT